MSYSWLPCVILNTIKTPRGSFWHTIGNAIKMPVVPEVCNEQKPRFFHKNYFTNTLSFNTFLHSFKSFRKTILELRFLAVPQRHNRIRQSAWKNSLTLEISRLTVCSPVVLYKFVFPHQFQTVGNYQESADWLNYSSFTKESIFLQVFKLVCKNKLL